MRAVVTGGAGFIGSHVADRLIGDGWTVTTVDNLDPYYEPEQKRRNIQQALGSSKYSFEEVDICDSRALDRVFDKARPDAVVHLAARAGVRASIDDPAAYVRVNELGGLNVLEACRQRDNVPIAFASTSSVYGDSRRIPFCEDDVCDQPLSPYAASKRGSEMMVHAYHHVHELPVAVLRFFTVYGPRGRPDMAVAKFTRQLLAGEPIVLHGEATERDFTYIGDIVDGVRGAIDWALETRKCDTFNLGRSEPVVVRRLIELLADRLDVEPKVRLGALMPGESERTAADVSKANAAFGYEPQVSLSDGVSRWVEWLESPEAPPRGAR